MSSRRTYLLPEPSTSSSSALVDDDDDEEEEEEEDEEDEDGRRRRRHEQDPYNRPDLLAQQEQQPHYHHQLLTESELQQQQYAYDSMSTILEVDSENSDESGELQRQALDSPLMVRTQPTPDFMVVGPQQKTNPTIKSAPQRMQLEDPEEGRVSPVGQDRFSGTLSALAQQVERLRRSSQVAHSMGETAEREQQSILKQSSSRFSSPSGSGSGSPEGKKVRTSSVEDDFEDSEFSMSRKQPSSTTAPRTHSHHQQQEPLWASKRQFGGHLSSSPTPQPQTPDVVQMMMMDQEQFGSPVEHQQTGSRQGRTPSSRAASAESLMMISVSPMASPRVKFPLLRARPRREFNRKGANSSGDEDEDDDQDDDDGQRRLVEVSNKSTITAIDLTLMDKLVQKYFVDTREKATQSIEFDCDETLDTIPGGRATTVAKQSGNLSGRRPNFKSVAVGTEKFSRERFSLLPPTTTRSTQTKPNLDDNDIGTSETRRYKLSHHLFGPVIRRQLPGARSDPASLDCESLVSADSSSAPTDSVTAAESGDTLEAAKVRQQDEKAGSKSTVPGKQIEHQASAHSPEPSAQSQQKQQQQQRQREQQQQTSPQPSSPANELDLSFAVQKQRRPAANGSSEREELSSAAALRKQTVGENKSVGVGKNASSEVSGKQEKSQVKKIFGESQTKQVKLSVSPGERDSLVGSLESVATKQQVHKSSQADALVNQQQHQTNQSGDSLSSSSASASREQMTGSGELNMSTVSIKSVDASSSQDSDEAESSKSDSLLEQQQQQQPSASADKTLPIDESKKKKREEEEDKQQEEATTNSPSIKGSKSSDTGTGSQPKSPSSRATIPSLKTELRVIIEFNDSRQRQRSEVTSNSQFIDGKLSKKMEVSTSKQVAASPREVYNKLQSIGRENSLLYRPATTTPPAAVAAANQSTLRSLSMTSLPRVSETEDETSLGSGSSSTRRWREVSRSSVRNEIETDTRRSSGSRRRTGKGARRQASSTGAGGMAIVEPIDEDIVMTSDATITHNHTSGADDSAAIELRSRAVRRRESLERDPRTGQLVRSGRVREQTLVESEAGFDEAAAAAAAAKAEVERRQQQQQRQPEVADRQQQKPPEKEPTRGVAASRPTMPSTPDSLLAREQVSSPAHTPTPPQVRRRPATPGPTISATQQRHSGGRQTEGRRQPTTIEQVARPAASKQRAGESPAAANYRASRLEIDEHREDRRQVTKNGQVIFDDRLRERRFETQRAGGSPAGPTERERQQQWAWQVPPSDTPLSPTMLQFQQRPRTQQPQAPTLDGRSANGSPGSPLSPTPGILRSSSRNGGGGGGGGAMATATSGNQQQQRANLLKPISLRATPSSHATNQPHQQQAPILFADQTSNLSSDPETMDSGFAQSGAGSGSALNQAHRQQQQQQASGRSQNPTANVNYRQMHQLQSPKQRRVQTDLVNSSGLSSPQMELELERRAASQGRLFSADLDRDLEQPESLNFVDDDVDELIDQLDSSRMLSPAYSSAATALGRQTTGEGGVLTRGQRATSNAVPLSQSQSHLSYPPAQMPLEKPLTVAAKGSLPGQQQPVGSPIGRRITNNTESPERFLISPPPAFCSSEPALNKLDLNRQTTKSKPTKPMSQDGGEKDTSLTTKLTRTKPKPEVAGQHELKRGRQRTLTKLEQNLVTPEQLLDGMKRRSSGFSNQRRAASTSADLQAKMCRFKAQVMFESDTDSMSTERHSVGSSRGAKELISETKFSRGPTKLDADKSIRDNKGKPLGPGVGSSDGQVEPGKAQIFANNNNNNCPKWDYSLRVNRMRGNRVDSKVNTYIKHSRQPLINSEAS